MFHFNFNFINKNTFSFIFIAIFFFFFNKNNAFAQDRLNFIKNYTKINPTQNLPKRVQLEDSLQHRKRLVSWGLGIGYTTALTGLSVAWYDWNKMGGFRFFNDDDEWQQMDKFGHFFTNFHFSKYNAQMLEWAGYSPKKSEFLGMTIASGVMLGIEILDGASPKYGFSWGDFTANTGGALFYWGQKALWKEIRILPKFSFFPTDLAPLRPNILGKNLAEQWLKDYNGQTYWYSVDMDKFAKKFPKWLNLCAGYGAYNMLYGNYAESVENGYTPYRRYFVGIDIDLSHIKTKNKFLKGFLNLLTMVRLPAPALEYNAEKGFEFHYIKF